MTEEIKGDLPEVEPAAAIDEGNEDALSNAIDKAMSHYDDEPKPVSDEPSRDEKGRFASKAEGNESPEAEPVAEQPDVQPAETEQPIEPPARWSEADKALFAQLPREAQSLLSERNKAMEADYTRKTQDIAEFRRHAEPLLNAVQPFSDYLAHVGQNMGLNTGQIIQNLLGAEYQLRNGTPEQKQAALARIAAEYGIAPQPLGSTEGEQPSARQPDPYVNHLYQQMPVIGQELNQLRQFREELEQERISRQVEDFRTAKDGTGQLLHPFFDDVRPQMSALMQAGQAATIDDAYRMATEPFQKVLQQQQAAAKQADEKAKAEALAKARKAAPVRAGGSSPRGVTQSKGLDAILNSALDGAGIA